MLSVLSTKTGTNIEHPFCKPITKTGGLTMLTVNDEDLDQNVQIFRHKAGLMRLICELSVCMFEN